MRTEAPSITVNMSDAQIASDPDAVLATYSLGSCIAVCLYDPITQIGGMLHYQLPTSTIDPERARQNPLMFADTGLAVMLKEIAARGADIKRLKVKLAGAAQIINDNNLFNIGKRNHAAIRKYLWQHGLLIDGEDIGGSSPRNVFFRLADGNVLCKSHDKSVTL